MSLSSSSISLVNDQSLLQDLIDLEPESSDTSVSELDDVVVNADLHERNQADSSETIQVNPF